MTDASPSPGTGRRVWLPRRERDWDRVAVAAIVLGALLRVVWLVVHPPMSFVYSDMAGYVARGQALASGAPLTPDDAFFPPGTHVLLAIPSWLFGDGAGLPLAALAWCLLSIATVALAWRSARMLLTPAAAAVTAVLCAGWPLAVTYGGYFTSETPAAAFLVAALWAGVAATRREGGAALALAGLAGLLGGAASAVRPQLLLNAVILVVVVLVLSRRRYGPAICVAAGLVAVLAAVVVHNSAATGQPTGLATNGGLNFWFGHCEARQVTTLDGQGRPTASFTHPVPNGAGRPGDYVFAGVGVGDEDFFVDRGRECIRQDGWAHVVRLGRNVLDMTATTTPWPQGDEQGPSRDVVQVANVVYSVLLPWILIESIALARRRRREGVRGGETILLCQLACAVVVAVLVIGDPRVRAVYDVFGLALLGALLADRFRLDAPREPPPLPT